MSTVPGPLAVVSISPLLSKRSTGDVVSETLVPDLNTP